MADGGEMSWMYIYLSDVTLTKVLQSGLDQHCLRMNRLPRHDFAALISYRYAGGLAFVSGMCTSKAVMLCGVCFVFFYIGLFL